jgi:hypothetical protein
MKFEELLLTDIPKKSTTRKKSEANFWKSIKQKSKKQLPQYRFTRLESWASLGVPDVLVCDDEGAFHLVELKSITGYASTLSPHQISFFSSHAEANAWIWIYKTGRLNAPQVFVYHASQIMELVKKGVKAEPFGVWEESGIDWREVWGKIKARRNGPIKS